MAITTEAGLTTAIQAGKRVRFFKAAVAGGAAGQFITFWRSAGMPGVGTTPTTTGTQLSRTSAGALPIPAASGTSYVAEWEGSGTNAGVVLLADRLVEFGGLSGIVTSAQAVSALALPSRATGATDVELWVETYAVSGATAVGSVTASYTNQAGTSGRTATVVGGFTASSANLAGRTWPMSLQAGDTGVQSVQSLTLGTSTGTAGNIGLVLRRTMLTGTVLANNSSFYQTWAETDLQGCADDAALEVMCLTGSSTSGNVLGAIRLAQG